MFELIKKHKMFRLYLLYQVFSGIGGGMFSMFMLLSMHMLYQNPVYTGIAGFLMAVPLIASFAVGPVVDRRNKVIIMRLTTFLEFLVLSLVAFTPLQEQLRAIFMFAVIFIYSMAALFEAPSGNSLLPQIVPCERILEANSLVDIVSFAGGIVVGIGLFTSLSEGMDVRFLYSLSAGFLGLAFLFTLFLRDMTPKKNEIAHINYMQDLKDGVKFLKGSVLLFLAVAAVTKNLVIEIASVNMPMFAEYHVGVQGYIVFALVGLVGGLIASSLIGVHGKRFRVGLLLFVLYISAGVMRIAFVYALPETYLLGLGVLFLFSVLSSASGVVYGSMEQKLPPKDMVGRIDTLTTTFIAIAVTFGALVGGFLGRIVPVIDHVFIYQGVSYMVIGVFLILIPKVRKLPKFNEIQ